MPCIDCVKGRALLQAAGGGRLDVCLALLQGTLARGDKDEGAFVSEPSGDEFSEGEEDEEGGSDVLSTLSDGDEEGGPGAGAGGESGGGAQIGAAVDQVTLDAALVEACRKGHGEVVELLLSVGAEPSRCLPGSALEGAMSANCARAVWLLIQVCGSSFRCVALHSGVGVAPHSGVCSVSLSEAVRIGAQAADEWCCLPVADKCADRMTGVSILLAYLH